MKLARFKNCQTNKDICIEPDHVISLADLGDGKCEIVVAKQGVRIDYRIFGKFEPTWEKLLKTANR